MDVTGDEKLAAGRAYLAALSHFGGIPTDSRVAEWLGSKHGQAMMSALAAAASARKAAEQEAEASSPWSRASASASAGLCMCHACVDARGEWQITMRLCPSCGNKRCPKVEDHRFRCSGSNDIGQVGVLEGVP